ncbi:MAG TPA: choice-of-anchor E domain-containing protein [Bryobacteraceae bacterium]|jgi:hypothetical protein|nr:choice-of-anchor E domain-containing protein [Bryobacteraceae bacterium]
MRIYRKVLITLAAAFVVSGIASADSITLGPLTTSTPVLAEATDWTNMLAFAQFDSNLGTLLSVTFDISGQLQTTLTVTNTDSAAGSSGNSRTELQIGLEDADDSLGLDIDNDTQAIDVMSGKYFYDLGKGQSSQSGLLTSSYDSGTLTYSSLTVLNEFSNPGGGTVDLTADTFTQTNLSNTGGNTNSNQVTNASLTGTVTYTYQAALQESPSTPEPATLAMMGGALLGLGLLRKRLRKN